VVLSHELPERLIPVLPICLNRDSTDQSHCGCFLAIRMISQATDVRDSVYPIHQKKDLRHSILSTGIASDHVVLSDHRVWLFYQIIPLKENSIYQIANQPI